MGILRLSCVSGCSCAPLDVDAHRPAVEESVLAIAQLNVTQSADCTLSLEVLEKTSSGEHKFKARLCGGAGLGLLCEAGGVAAGKRLH